MAKNRRRHTPASSTTPASRPAQLPLTHPTPPRPSHSHSLNLRRVPAAIRDHQPVPLRNRLSRPELIHLIEHEREAGAGVRPLAQRVAAAA